MEFFNIISFVLSVAALIVVLVSLIWLISRAFAEHYLWGVAVLCLPMAQIVFAILHWDRARRPAVLGLVALAAFILLVLVTATARALLGD